jgi:hypothetical protein
MRGNYSLKIRQLISSRYIRIEISIRDYSAFQTKNNAKDWTRRLKGNFS